MMRFLIMLIVLLFVVIPTQSAIQRIRNENVNMLIEKIPKIADTIELDTAAKVIEVLTEISKDEKIKGKMFNEFKIYFESQTEHDEYIRHFVALLQELIYSAKYKIKGQIPFIISNIHIMMEKANGRVARRILSLMMTKVKPYLAKEDVDAIKRFFNEGDEIEEGSNFVIPPLAMTHFLLGKDHKMKGIIPAHKEDKTNMIRKIKKNLQDQFHDKKLEFLVPAVKSLVKSFTKDQKMMLKAIVRDLEKKGGGKFLHRIQKKIRMKRDLNSIQMQLGLNMMGDKKVDPKVFMTLMLQNLLNNEKSKQLGRFMNFFFGKFTKEFHAELFLKLFKITKEKIAPHDQILLEMLWNPLLKRLTQGLDKESMEKLKGIKETFETSADEDARTLSEYFNKAMAKRPKRDLTLQLFENSFKNPNEFFEKVGLPLLSAKMLGEKAMENVAPVVNGIISGFSKESEEELLKRVFEKFKGGFGKIENFVVSRSDDWIPHVRRLGEKLDKEAKERLLEVKNDLENGKNQELGHFLKRIEQKMKPEVEVVA